MESFNVDQISTMFKVNVETVRRWIRNGKLRAYKNSKRQGYIISYHDIQAFCNSHPAYKKYVKGALMDDSISRKDAIRWIKTECNPYGKPTLDYDTSLRIIEHLKRMSSIDAAPVRHGTWTRVGDFSYRCSECGEVSCCFADYCPDCGARME